MSNKRSINVEYSAQYIKELKQDKQAKEDAQRDIDALDSEVKFKSEWLRERQPPIYENNSIHCITTIYCMMSYLAQYYRESSSLFSKVMKSKIVRDNELDKVSFSLIADKERLVRLHFPSIGHLAAGDIVVETSGTGLGAPLHDTEAVTNALMIMIDLEYAAAKKFENNE